jgi:hypothetical protein
MSKTLFLLALLSGSVVAASRSYFSPMGDRAYVLLQNNGDEALALYAALSTPESRQNDVIVKQAKGAYGTFSLTCTRVLSTGTTSCMAQVLISELSRLDPTLDKVDFLASGSLAKELAQQFAGGGTSDWAFESADGKLLVGGNEDDFVFMYEGRAPSL